MTVLTLASHLQTLSGWEAWCQHAKTAPAELGERAAVAAAV
jgi:hypothetical protein